MPRQSPATRIGWIRRPTSAAIATVLQAFCSVLVVLFLVAVDDQAALADSVTVDLEYRTDTLTWELYVQVMDTGSGNSGDFGIAAVRALLDNVDAGSINLASGIGAIDPIDQGGPNERPAVLATSGGTIDIIYGQDLSTPASVVDGVGIASRSLIMNGTFASAGMPPAFGDDDFSRTTDGNFLTAPAPGPFGTLPWNGRILNVMDVTPIILAGDYNDDGMVDIADYTVWRDNLGALDETALMGNGDGMNGVDIGDYTRWKDHFGDSLPASVQDLATVPEPAAFSTMAVCILLCVAMRPWTRLVGIIGSSRVPGHAR